MRLFPLYFLVSLLVGTQVSPASDIPPAELLSFLDRHCTECHDDVTAEAKLNLLDLSFTLSDPDVFHKWQRIFERVHDGEMPPAKKPRPESAASEAFLSELVAPLVKTDLAAANSEGRVRGRRLTRVEYEHTLHDLLGIDIPLTGLLPEDPATAGFETVAAGQQLSQHQVARYLDTADLALHEAFTRALEGDEAFSKTFTPDQLVKKGGGNYRGPELREGRNMIWPMTLQFVGRLAPTDVPEDGWYRVTLHQVHAVNPKSGGVVWGTLRSGECESNAPLLSLIGLIEATDTPRDLIYEAWFLKGHRLELRPSDSDLKNARTGATGGNVSYVDRDLAKEGYSGIAHRGITIERIYPNADRSKVKKNLFGQTDLAAVTDPEGSLEELTRRFASRAFRRPVTPDQLSPYLALGQAALAEGSDLPTTLHTVYRAILCSPRFLTFIEKPGALDDYTIASRLSYALWVSLPDAKLIEAAASGDLRKPTKRAEQIERLLADPKSQRFIKSFTNQWLKLNQIDFTTPDPRRFSGFDATLQESMLQETRAYLGELIKNDQGISNLVVSEFAFLNERLVRHYGIDGVTLKAGIGVQKVSLPKKAREQRGGLITQGAVLKVTADGSHTSPVVRGVFVNERILGVHLPPPPPGIPAIEPDIRGAVSIRDQLEKHRSSETCMSCHLTIDPPGFVLENFDPIGAWRTRYGTDKTSARVNSAGSTRDGAAFAGLADWRRIYEGRSDQLAEAFVKQFLTYATGATPRFGDRIVLAEIVEAEASKSYGVRSLIETALQSSIFLSK